MKFSTNLNDKDKLPQHKVNYRMRENFEEKIFAVLQSIAINESFPVNILWGTNAAKVVQSSKHKNVPLKNFTIYDIY